jgi:DNA-binding beta-propeller fold protein YncE
MSKIQFKAGVAALSALIMLGAGPVFAQQGQETAPPMNQASTGPRLDFPAGIATDGVSLYVANGRNNTIDKIDLTSHSISQLAGQLFKAGSMEGPGPNALFSGPSGIALVGNDIYVADTNNSTIRKVSATSGNVMTFAGSANIPGNDDGRGNAAHFNEPTQIAADPNGQTLYVTDTSNDTIRAINIADATVKTIGGQVQTEGKDDGPATKSTFTRPRGIATDGKFVYVSDTGDDIIRKIDLSTMTSSLLAGTGAEGNQDGAGNQAQFNNPGAMTTDGKTLYVMDADNHAVRKINLATSEVGTVTLVNGHIGSGCGISHDGSVVYFSDTTENAVQQVSVGNGNVTPIYPPQ